jgi:hypothetical protein
VTKIDELGKMLVVTSNRSTQRRFLQEPQGVTSQQTASFNFVTHRHYQEIQHEDFIPAAVQML